MGLCFFLGGWLPIIWINCALLFRWIGNVQLIQRSSHRIESSKRELNINLFFFQNGHQPIVQILLEQDGIQILASDRQGYTAYTHAVQVNILQICIN